MAVMKPGKQMTLTRTMHEKMVIMFYGTEQSWAFCPPSFSTSTLTCSSAKAPVALMAWGWKNLCPRAVMPTCCLMPWEWLDSKKRGSTEELIWSFNFVPRTPILCCQTRQQITKWALFCQRHRDPKSLSFFMFMSD